jgi:hypothetical protein
MYLLRLQQNLFQTNDLYFINKTEIFQSYNVKWNKYWQCVDFFQF